MCNAAFPPNLHGNVCWIRIHIGTRGRSTALQSACVLQTKISGTCREGRIYCPRCEGPVRGITHHDGILFCHHVILFVAPILMRTICQHLRKITGMSYKNSLDRSWRGDMEGGGWYA